MISLQGFFLRTFLQLRKAGMDWDAPVEKIRANLRLSDRFVKLPHDIEIKPDLAEGVPVEWIIPPHVSERAVIYYIHGGGWTLGWTNLHRRLVSHLCKSASTRALAIDYRLAPEHPFPAALEDCYAVYHWLLKNGFAPQNIVIAGDSAGANLALATLISLRDAGDPLPLAAVCISPMIDLLGTGETFQMQQDPALTATFALMMARHYASKQDPHSSLLSPLYGDLQGFPPLLIHVGEDEILLSDGKRLAEKAQAADIDVTLVIWPKMWHVWHLFVPVLPEAQQAVNAIGAFILEHLGREQFKMLNQST
jgi:monoterpene epsilon-lactone hydrolase